MFISTDDSEKFPSTLQLFIGEVMYIFRLVKHRKIPGVFITWAESFQSILTILV